MFFPSKTLLYALTSLLFSQTITALTSLPEPTLYTRPGSDVVLIKTYVTFDQAEALCCANGFYLASITTANWEDANYLMNTHLGVNKLAYLAKWNNNNYENNVCLAAQTGSTLGSMAINPAQNCNYYLSVLCTVEPPLGSPATCSSGLTTVTSTSTIITSVTSTTATSTHTSSISTSTETSTITPSSTSSSSTG